VTREPVEVVDAPALAPVRSASTDKREEMPTKQISERALAMSVEREDDHTPISIEVGRQSVAELRATNESYLAVANLQLRHLMVWMRPRLRQRRWLPVLRYAHQ